MTEETIVTKKEVYNLWWEYLKRSDNFRKLCTAIKNIRHDDKENEYEVFERVEEAWFLKDPAKSKKEREKRERENYLLYVNYEMFGDVFESSFEDWWAVREQELPVKDKVINLSYEEAHEDIIPRLENTYDSLKKMGGKDTGIDMFLEALACDPFCLYIAVPVFGDLTAKEIAAQITEMRKRLRKDQRRLRLDRFFKRHIAPIGRIRFDEQKRYLRIYDQKQQDKTLTEIARLEGRDAENDDEISKLSADIKRAERIIKNIENGNFPGNYQPNSSNPSR